MASYFRPTELSQALAALSECALTIVAGATDYYPTQVGRRADHDILDPSAIEALHGIEAEGDYWRIGAMTTWRDLMDAELPPCFDGLKAAARQVGGPHDPLHAECLQGVERRLVPYGDRRMSGKHPAHL